MADNSLDKLIELRIMSMIEDHDIIRRSMQQNFVALTQQNLGFSMRCGQKHELQTLEKEARQPTPTATHIAPIDINKLKI